MSSVQDISNCSDRGLYYQGSCQCDLGYFGDDCSLQLEQLHIATYFTFIGFYSLIFTLLLIITLKQLQLSLKMNKIPSYQRGITYIKNVLGSPLNCILLLTILFCILKILWLVIDPFQIYNYQQRVIERIMAEVVYTILFYIYGILLMVWYTMYDEISFNISEKQVNNKSLTQNKRKLIFRYYKDIMKIRLFLVLIIQLIVSTLNGLRLGQQYKTILYVAYVLLLLNFVSFIFEFLLYGRSLNQCIEKQLKRLDFENRTLDRKNDDKKQEQITILSKTQLMLHQDEHINSPATPEQQIIPLSSYDESDESHEQSSTQRNVQQIQFKKQVTFMSPQNIITNETKREVAQTYMKTIVSEDSQNSQDEVNFHVKANSCLINDCDINPEELKWNIQKERINIKKLKRKQIKVVEQTKQQVSETKRQRKIALPFLRATVKDIDQLQQQQNEQSQDDIIPKKFMQTDTYQVEMQAQQRQTRSANLNSDKKVLSKIQLLIYAGVFLEICFGALSLIILLTDLLQYPVGTICYLYISGMLQFCSLITVLKLFRDVRSQEILNLIWIQKIGNRKNKINQEFIFEIPHPEKKKDESKRKFEQRINMHIR